MPNGEGFYAAKGDTIVRVPFAEEMQVTQMPPEFNVGEICMPNGPDVFVSHRLSTADMKVFDAGNLTHLRDVALPIAPIIVCYSSAAIYLVAENNSVVKMH